MRLALETGGPPAARHPFSCGDHLAQFLTNRLHGYVRASAGVLLDGPVRHPPMRPLSAALAEAEIPLWRDLGVLSDDEAGAPHSVLVDPSMRITLLAPRLLLGV